MEEKETPVFIVEKLVGYWLYPDGERFSSEVRLPDGNILKRW